MPRITLEQLHIPAPCSADWAAMAGDDRRRFCDSCEKHVVDLSAHTRAEAEAIVNEALPGGLCAQFRFDADGHMVTRDRPPRRRWRTPGVLASAALAFVATLVGCKREPQVMLGTPRLITSTTQPAPLPGAVAVMGDVCPTPTTAPATRPTPLDTSAMIRGEVALPAMGPTR